MCCSNGGSLLSCSFCKFLRLSSNDSLYFVEAFTFHLFSFCCRLGGWNRVRIWHSVDRRRLTIPVIIIRCSAISFLSCDNWFKNPNKFLTLRIRGIYISQLICQELISFYQTLSEIWQSWYQMETIKWFISTHLCSWEDWLYLRVSRMFIPKWMWVVLFVIHVCELSQIVFQCGNPVAVTLLNA